MEKKLRRNSILGQDSVSAISNASQETCTHTHTARIPNESSKFTHLASHKQGMEIKQIFKL